MSTDDQVLDQQTEKKEVQNIPVNSFIEINDKGLVEAKNNSELLRYCKAIIKSKMVPSRFKEPEELFGALMFTRSLGLPDACIRQVAVIHNSPSLFGDLPLALCQSSKEITHFKEQWFNKDYKIICFEEKNLSDEAFGSVCFLERKNMGIQSFAFTLEDAKKAGVYPAGAAMPWSKYTKLMLRYKARAIALKSLFADKLNGVAIAEYDHDVNDPEFKDVTPQSELAKELNNLS